eukprot:733883_1
MVGGVSSDQPLPLPPSTKPIHRRHPSIHRQRLHLPPAGKCNHHGHPQTTSVTVPTPRRAPNAAPRGGGELCPRSHRMPTSSTSVERGRGSEEAALPRVVELVRWRRMELDQPTRQFFSGCGDAGTALPTHEAARMQARGGALVPQVDSDERWGDTTASPRVEKHCPVGWITLEQQQQQ